jgi:hypothetical protein
MTVKELELQDDKARAEIAKLTAETAEILQNMKYRFWVLAAAYIGALAVVLKFVWVRMNLRRLGKCWAFPPPASLKGGVWVQTVGAQSAGGKAVNVQSTQ